MTDDLKGLDAWFDYCCKTPLPVTSRSVVTLARAIHKGDTDFHQLSLLVARDPALCFHLLQNANQINNNPDTEIRTLDHAISLLGITRLEELLKELPKFKIDLKQLGHRRYLQCLSTSLHAAYQAKAWTQIKGQHKGEGLYWASLFYQCLHWQLWHCAKDQMRKREVLIKKRGLPAQVAEKHIFGMPLEQLALKLAEHWHLPTATRKALIPSNRPSRRQLIELNRDNFKLYLEQNAELRMLIQQPEFMVFIANWLAAEACNDWYGRSTLRAQKVAANYCNMTLLDTVDKSHHLAVELSHEHPIPAVSMPGAKLLLPAHVVQQSETTDTQKSSAKQAPAKQAPVIPAPVKQTAHKKPAAKPAQVVDKAKTAKPQSLKPRPSQANKGAAPAAIGKRLQDTKKLNIALKQLTQQPETFADLHQLMHCCNDAITGGLSLKRSLILIANSSQSQMRVYYKNGVPQGVPLAQYRIDLQQPGLIKKLMSKKSGFQITPENYAKVSGMLPKDFAEIVASRDLFLMSIFSGDRAVGMVMADAKGHPAALTTDEYSTFKQLCQGVCHTLEQMSQRNHHKNHNNNKSARPAQTAKRARGSH